MTDSEEFFEGNTGRPVLIIPCFNEEDRLNLRRVGMLTLHFNVLFIDDGSTDGTLELLNMLEKQHKGQVEVVPLKRNRGKAYAVWSGIFIACQTKARVVGYADADFATPPSEIIRLYEVLKKTGAHGVIGSRVRMLGMQIDRNPIRHYLGRIFSTLASLVLDMPVYDTQCGAKFFCITAFFMKALDKPFRTDWAFDVELLKRLRSNKILEVPLRLWTDVEGSKVSVFRAFWMFFELLRIWLGF